MAKANNRANRIQNVQSCKYDATKQTTRSTNSNKATFSKKQDAQAIPSNNTNLSITRAHSSTQKSSKLTIVQAVHAFPPAIGGIETHVYNLCLELAKRGHTVIVHTSNHPNSKQIDDELKEKGIIIKRHFALNFPGFSSVKLMPFLCVSLILERADIYHSHGYGALVPIQTSIASFIKRKKFIWTIHGFPRFNGLKQIFPALYSIIASIPLHLSSNIICVSDSVYSLLPKTFHSKAVVIPNAINDSFLKAHVKKSAHTSHINPQSNQTHNLCDEKNQFKILFVGRLDKSKGIFMLASAFNAFKKTHNACLCYNGPDEANNKEKLLNFAKENNFCIEFSHVPMSEMPQAYSCANVTVLPSDYEGFGLSVIESWAVGTIAISTHVGIAPQFFKQAFNDDAHNFLFHDEKSLIKSLEFIHSLTPTQLENYCKKAKDTLKDYSWEIVAKKTIDIY